MACRAPPHEACVGSGLGMLISTLAAVSKEVAEHFGGFGFEETLLDGDGVVETGVGWDVVEGSGVTGLRVGGGVD